MADHQAEPLSGSLPKENVPKTDSFATENKDEEIDHKVWLKGAEEGNEEDQLKLGLHFLKLAELDIDKDVNAEAAVKWLITASKQGNEEATSKLRHCAQTSLGVTDANKVDVEWCLNTSASEKKIRNAARSLYSKINSASSDVLSKEEYMKAINELTAGHEKERKLLLAAGKKIGDTITENDFVKTLSEKLHGKLTLTSSEMDENTADYNSAGIAKKVFIYPKETAKIVFDQGLEYASNEGMNIVLSLIPTNQLYLLAMVFIYGYLTPKLFLLVVPLFIFYISVVVIIVCTLQMFYRRFKQKDAASLANLLQDQFNMNIDTKTADSQYSWNSLTPYLVFFSILPLVVLSFSLANKSYIPCAEMFVVCIVMCGFCFIGLNDSHDTLTLAALASHGFASLPIFLSHFPRITFITSAVEFFIHPLFSFDIGMGVSFNISLPAIVHLAIPVLLVHMAMRDGWSGTYRTVIPHLICYFWFSLSVVVFPFTTFKGLARATVGYLLLPLMVPLSAVFAVGAILYFLYQLLMTPMAGKLVFTLMLLAVPILMTQSKLFIKKGEKLSAKMEKIRIGVMIGFSVLAIIPLFFIHAPALIEKKVISLQWEEYKELCLPGKADISAPYQLRCRDFVGTKVNWTGSVAEVKVVKVENTAESVINTLPSIFADPLYCLYGEPIEECDPETLPEKALKHCQLITSTGRDCHLRNHNQITLSLSVTIDDVTMQLEAGSNFNYRLMALSPGDKLQFTASLVDVGTAAPKLKLKDLNCLSRELPVMGEMEDEVDEDMIYMMGKEAVATTFNFGFYPVLKLSPA